MTSLDWSRFHSTLWGTLFLKFVMANDELDLVLSTSEDEEDNTENLIKTPSAYAFEPVTKYTVSDRDNTTNSDSSEEELSQCVLTAKQLNQWRLNSCSWCTCNCCILMPTVVECRCCKESSFVHLLAAVKRENLGCITQLPMFNSVCLERDVLEVAIVNLRHARASIIERPINSTYVFENNCQQLFLSILWVLNSTPILLFSIHIAYFD